MILGVNYAGRRFGWDFGPPPESLAGVAAKASSWADPSGPRGKTALDVALENFKALGLSVVRFPLLGDAWNYGTPAGSWEGWRWTWSFDPPDLDVRFLEDLDLLLGVFRRNGMRVMPVLISFEAFQAGTLVINGFQIPLGRQPAISRGHTVDDFVREYFLAPEEVRRPGDPRAVLDPSHSIDYRQFVKGGKADIISDPGKQARFLDAVLQPLLDVARLYPDVIEAFDLCNEPDLLTDLPQQQLRGFLSAGCQRAAQAGLRSTVGLQKAATIPAWNLPDSLKQFHYYPETDPKLGELPALADACLGELATADVNLVDGSLFRAWPPARGARQSLSERLRLVEAKGFRSALLWSADAHDPFTRWNPATWSELMKFQGRSYP